jgi:hypothetical protein
MASIFEKLNLKGQSEILIVNAPASFEAELAQLKGITILRDPRDAKTIQLGGAGDVRGHGKMLKRRPS